MSNCDRLSYSQQFQDNSEGLMTKNALHLQRKNCESQNVSENI